MVFEKQNPRKKAVEILSTILDQSRPLKSVLDDRVLSNFEPSDRAFLKELVYGVLRNLIYIDYFLEPFYRNKKILSSKTINNLRSSIYQLIFLNLPDYAVTNEAVNVEKAINGSPSVVNGILRNFLRNYQDKIICDDVVFQRLSNDKLKFLSINYSYPEWLIKRWLSRFGLDELQMLLKVNNEKPPFTIAVKTEERQAVADYLSNRGFITSFTRYSPSGIIVEGKGSEIRLALKESPFFWIVQDEASQLVCHFLEPLEGEIILDACAAPGGKAILTAILIKKGKIYCLERDRERFGVLQQNIERVKNFIAGVEIKPILINLFELNNREKFDRIILDAPCSSIGVIRRNPDIKYRCSDREIERLSEYQLKMLSHISKFLKEKGSMIYSVCSTEPEEGERVIENFLHNHQEFCTMSSTAPFLRKLQLKEGVVRTFPHVHNMDGFFMARIFRR